MGLFDWLRGKRRAEATSPDLDDVADDQPDRGTPVFGGPERPLLYMFQHVALREAAFENHPELIRELEGEPAALPLLHFRSKARLRCEVAGLIDSDSLDDDAELDAEEELFDAVEVHPHRRGGYTAHVVTMPAPELSPEAYFVAIVHRDDEPHEYMRESPSTRYFTLERADDGGRPLLCEWRADGTHANYGEGPEPRVPAFVEAVFERVSAGGA